MLTDYEIKRVDSRRQRWLKVIPFIQFMLLLIALQCALFLLSGEAGREAVDSLRIRVIADSNTAEAQQLKAGVVSAIAPIVHQAQEKSRSEEELASYMKGSEPAMMKAASEAAGGVPVRIERSAAFIPPKVFAGGIIPQTRSDAYVVTIGSGRGDNWWCALFSDVCSPAEASAEELEEAEEEEEPVTFFIVEWLKSLFA